MSEFTPERIAGDRRVASSQKWLDALDEIERLQARERAASALDARDHRRELLLRDALEQLAALVATMGGHPEVMQHHPAVEVRDRIRAELGDAQPRTVAEAIYGSETGR